jgi:hypothetical protein
MFDRMSCSSFLKEKCFQMRVVEKITTHFMFRSILPKIMPFSGQATDDNMVHVDCVLDTEGYKHTLRICNTYCCSTATGCMNAPKCYVSHTVHVLLILLVLCMTFLLLLLLCVTFLILSLLPVTF